MTTGLSKDWITPTPHRGRIAVPWNHTDHAGQLILCKLMPKQMRAMITGHTKELTIAMRLHGSTAVQWMLTVLNLTQSIGFCKLMLKQMPMPMLKLATTTGRTRESIIPMKLPGLIALLWTLTALSHIPSIRFCKLMLRQMPKQMLKPLTTIGLMRELTTQMRPLG